jgi:hypothetical protein
MLRGSKRGDSSAFSTTNSNGTNKVIDTQGILCYSFPCISHLIPPSSLSFHPPPSPFVRPPAFVVSVLRAFLLCPVFSVLVTRHPPLATVHLSLLLSMASGLFCTMDARNSFPFNRLWTLSIAMGVYTPPAMGVMPVPST